MRAHFTSDRPFWIRVWAQRILSRIEREYFRRLHTPEHRQLEWLAARTAAKEAVQQLLQATVGLTLLLADIEIIPDEQGRPHVGGSWQSSLNVHPTLSIAHTAGWATALAGISTNGQMGEMSPLVGIDMEQVAEPAANFSEMAFTSEELRLLGTLPPSQYQEWMLRCWCAKEAVTKALGRGLVDGLSATTILALDTTDEVVTIQLAGRLALLFPELAATALAVYTTRQQELIVATTLCEPVNHAVKETNHGL
jgi:holo-[acyl-carrier-protein] synthase